MKKNFANMIQNLRFSQIAAGLFLLGLMAYANAIAHPFVHDDIVFIRNNPLITDWTHVFSFFIQPVFTGGDSSVVNNYYRPLLEIVYRMEYLAFRLDPHGYHRFNILLHILNSILAYLSVMLFTRKKIFALSVAVLFLVHPVQAEAVACIAGISNLLFVFFCFISFILYVMASQQWQGRRAIGAYGLSLIIYIAALLTKEQAIVLFFLLVLYEFCFSAASGATATAVGTEAVLARGFMPRLRAVTPHFGVQARASGGPKGRPLTTPVPSRANLGRLCGFLVISVAYFVLRKLILNTAVVNLTGSWHELYLRVLSVPAVLLMYLRLLVWPTDLHYYRCTDILGPVAVPTIGFLIVTIAVMRAVFFMPKNERTVAYFGLGWFILTLMPVLNIVPLIVEYSFIMSSEHFLYFPLVGFLIFSLAVVTYYLKIIFKEKMETVAAALFLMVMCIFLVATIRQNTYWKGEIPLFRRTLQFERNLGRVHILLARAYYADRQFDAAMAEYRAALKIMQGYAGKVQAETVKKFYTGFIKEIYFDLAHCYEARQDFRGALGQYQEVLAIDPNDDTVHNNIGAGYLYLKETDKAIDYFRKAVSLNSKNVMAMNNLAVCYINKNNPHEAQRWLKEALSIDGNFTPARQNLERLRQAEQGGSR